MDLRRLLKEYLELNNNDIEIFIRQFEKEWYTIIAERLPDVEAAEVMEKLLGKKDLRVKP